MKRILSFCVAVYFLATLTSMAQTQPPLFTNTLVSNTWDELEGFIFDATGQEYVWEKAGLVWVVDSNGNKLPQPLIDIHDEVGNWRDHGLNGFALDPNFRTNGYFYLYYTVDRHHLLYYGTPTYNVDSNWYFEATIARITRYTASGATNFTTTIPGSRHILIGETKKTGMVVTFDTHSGGTLVFGTDGSLLVSTGDGASPATADSGRINPALSYWPAALADSMITPNQNVGAYRSQLVNSLNGKILRIDPATGDGLPSNPFYDSTNARAPQSRVWALGLRNPFRVILKPGSGVTDPTAGNPGTLYIGDVGWQFWEDVNVCTGPGQNFGWPVYQGFDLDPNYFGSKQYNFDAPNPLFGVGGCTKPYFTFHDLIQNPTANGIVSFPNPCNASVQIPSGIKKFVHARPAIDFSHGNESRTGIFSGNTAGVIDIDSASSPVNGVRFGGYSSIAGFWYTGDKWPIQYQNSYYHGDYAGQWIKQFKFNVVDTPTYVNHFADSVGAVVYMLQKNNDGCIYYVNYPFEIRKICYTGAVNNPPVAKAIANINYGASPLVINFSGSQSYDPTNDPLTYSWKFGDGGISTSMTPNHTYTVPGNVIQNYWAVLTVSDNAGNSAKDSVFISVNNTPPFVDITSFDDGDLYSILNSTNLPLQATVTDPQHGPSQLFYKWEVFLHHNTHEHPETADTNKVTSALISPIGCNGESYSYRIRLTVKDAGGLSGFDEGYIYPNCCQLGAPLATISPSGPISVCVGTTVLNANTGSGLSYQWKKNGVDIAGANTASYTATSTGSYTVVVSNASSCSATSSAVSVTLGNLTAGVTPSGTLVLCSGSSTVLSATAGTGYSYQWYRNNVVLATATSQSFTTSTAGTYKCVVSSASCSATTNSVVISVINNPTATFTYNSPLSFCSPGSVTFTANSYAGVVYQWENNNVAIAGATSVSYVATTAGQYRVKQTANGCDKYSGKVTVSTASIPAAAISTNDPTTLCAAGTVTMNVTSPVPGYNYQWQNNGLNIAGATGTSYGATASGNYTVKATASCGTGTSNSISVSIGSFNAQVSPSGTAALCSGGSLTLSANTGTGFSYQWMNNGVNIAGATGSTLTVSNSGSYSVFMSSACGTATSAATTVTIASVTASVTPAGSSTVCSGTSITYTANVGSGYTYRWYRNNVLLAATTQSFTTSTAGSYKVEVSVSGSCPVQSNTVVLTVTNNPTATVTAGGPTTFCTGQSVTLTTNSYAGVSYQWQKNSTNIAGATGQSYTATTTGSYRVQHTANGCSKYSAQNAVSVTNCARVGDNPTGQGNNNASGLSNITVFPNPFADKLNIEITSPLNEQTEIRVVDVLGKEQFKTTIASNVSYELNTPLPPGVYMVTAKINNQVKTIRIVKTK